MLFIFVFSDFSGYLVRILFGCSLYFSFLGSFFFGRDKLYREFVVEVLECIIWRMVFFLIVVLVLVKFFMSVERKL